MQRKVVETVVDDVHNDFLKRHVTAEKYLYYESNLTEQCQVFDEVHFYALCHMTAQYWLPRKLTANEEARKFH